MIIVRIPSQVMLAQFLPFFQPQVCIKPKDYMGAFTLDVKSMLNENLGGILGGTKC